MRRFITVLVGLLCAGLLVTQVAFAGSEPASGTDGSSGRGVPPQVKPGNPFCSDLGYGSDNQFVVDGSNGTFSDGDLSVTITNSNGTMFDWSSNKDVQAVFAKGGDEGGNLYDYSGFTDNGGSGATGGASSDTQLHPPPTGNGGNAGYAGISHIVFCYSPSGAPNGSYGPGGGSQPCQSNTSSDNDACSESGETSSSGSCSSSDQDDCNTSTGGQPCTSNTSTNNDACSESGETSSSASCSSSDQDDCNTSTSSGTSGNQSPSPSPSPSPGTATAPSAAPACVGMSTDTDRCNEASETSGCSATDVDDCAPGVTPSATGVSGVHAVTKKHKRSRRRRHHSNLRRARKHKRHKKSTRRHHASNLTAPRFTG